MSPSGSRNYQLIKALSFSLLLSGCVPDAPEPSSPSASTHRQNIESGDNPGGNGGINGGNLPDVHVTEKHWDNEDGGWNGGGWNNGGWGGSGGWNGGGGIEYTPPIETEGTEATTNDPHAGTELFVNGELRGLKFNTSQGVNANHLEVTLKIEDGKITGVTSHMAGITGGATYVQTDWVQNSSSNGKYFEFSFSFHANFSIPILGIGDLGSGETVIAHCTYDTESRMSSISYTKE